MDLNKRIDTLDYLRGFALLGIILVNILSLLSVKLPASGSLDASYLRFLYMFVEGRFYTIFTFLFGVGFYIFINRAFARGKNGYVLFVRRILVLFLLGLIHVKFHHGEALTVYAVSGLLILPFYKAGKWLNLGFGAVMLLVMSFFANKIFMVVPIMLIGVAAGQYHVFERIPHNLRKIAIFTVAVFLLSAAGLVYQYQYAPYVLGKVSGAVYQETHKFMRIGVTIGPIVSAFYMGFMILLLQVPIIAKLLSPLKSYGRMALTNYISQTVLILFAGKLLHLYNHITYVQSLFLCLVIIFAQLIFSSIWLHFFRHGPLEWLWRTITYREI